MKRSLKYRFRTKIQICKLEYDLPPDICNKINLGSLLLNKNQLFYFFKHLQGGEGVILVVKKGSGARFSFEEYFERNFQQLIPFQDFRSL